MWSATRLSELLRIRYPIVQAPMAGGFTPPRLVAAVSDAGALGSFGAAMSSPDQIRDAVAEIRSLTDKPFGVNLFAPQPPPALDPERVAAVRAVARPARRELGLPEPELPKPPGWTFETQLQAVVEARPPVFSFTFGIPPLGPVREAGSVILGSATTVAEALELERAGVDAVVAQSAEAGGHRGTFLGTFEGSLVGAVALVPQIADAVSVPVVAAGAIMDGRGIAAAPRSSAALRAVPPTTIAMLSPARETMGPSSLPPSRAAMRAGCARRSSSASPRSSPCPTRSRARCSRTSAGRTVGLTSLCSSPGRPRRSCAGYQPPSSSRRSSARRTKPSGA